MPWNWACKLWQIGTLRHIPLNAAASHPSEMGLLTPFCRLVDDLAYLSPLVDLVRVKLVLRRQCRNRSPAAIAERTLCYKNLSTPCREFSARATRQITSPHRHRILRLGSYRRATVHAEHTSNRIVHPDPFSPWREVASD
jgi:hypothetical protein